jgi:hypothetical protein
MLEEESEPVSTVRGIVRLRDSAAQDCALVEPRSCGSRSSGASLCVVVWEKVELRGSEQLANGERRKAYPEVWQSNREALGALGLDGELRRAGACSGSHQPGLAMQSQAMAETFIDRIMRPSETEEFATEPASNRTDRTLIRLEAALELHFLTPRATDTLRTTLAGKAFLAPGGGHRVLRYCGAEPGRRP